jgi:hypothetical protein|tara:strand:- start:43 stop:219 length:177 start_codon:yes stop_codon:yes gene_type:complete
MVIENAKYEKHLGENCGIEVTINGEICHVPIDQGNKDYIEIMRQVESGELTIAPADAE